MQACRTPTCAVRSGLLPGQWIAVAGLAVEVDSCPSRAPPPTDPDNKIIDAVKGAISTVVTSVDIKRADGKLNIGVTGATVESLGATPRPRPGSEPGRHVTVQASKANFYLQGQLSKDRMGHDADLSTGKMAVPDLSKLGDVFGKGEQVMAVASWPRLPRFPT